MQTKGIMRRSGPASRALYTPRTFLTSRSLCAVHAVGIRPRRRIFYDMWLLIIHAIGVDGQHSLPKPSWRAPAPCALISPSARTPPAPPMEAQAEARGMPHTVCPLAINHTHIRPGKKSQRKAKGGSLRIGEFWPVERRGSVCAPVPQAPQPASAR